MNTEMKENAMPELLEQLIGTFKYVEKDPKKAMLEGHLIHMAINKAQAEGIVERTLVRYVDSEISFIAD